MAPASIQSRVTDQIPHSNAAKPAQPQAVAVRFKGDSDRLKKLKESFNYQMKMVEEEPWVECEYQQARTGDWDSVCQKLFCNKTNPVTVLNSSTQQYLCDMKDLNEIL